MKTILITGASSDIGMAYMQRLQESVCISGDAQIVAHYRTMSEGLGKLLATAKNVQIDAMQADLSLPDAVYRLIEQIKQKYTAPTHILHLAAGRFHHMRLRQFDTELTAREMQIQVYSFAEMLKAFLPAMAKNKYGKVAVMLTAYTFGIPPKFVTDYITCKYALLGLTKAAAAEYCDKGICINALSPSLIETKFLAGIDSRVAEMSAEGSPLGRNVSIDEVLTAIDFLLSDDNAYMCGTNLNLSGGGVANMNISKDSWACPYRHRI